MPIQYTPNYRMPYLDDLTPLRQLADTSRQIAEGFDAAMGRAGYSPPDATTFATLNARVSAMQTVQGEVVCSSASGALAAAPADVPGASVSITPPLAGTLHVTATFDFSLGVTGDLLAGYLNVDGTDRTPAVIVQGVSRCTASRSWAVPLTAAAHTIKLRAARITGSGTDITNDKHTGFTYRFVPTA